MAIPKHAKRVFKGVIFDVYQWEEKRYDGSIGLWEAIRRQPTITIIPVSGEDLYLSFEEQPGKPLTYTFLGGRGEEGEDPLETAKRELLEESGMESDDWELYKDYTKKGKIEWPIYLFIARNCKRVAEQQLDVGEKVEVRKHSFTEFMDIVTSVDFWARDISDDFFRMLHERERLTDFKKRLGIR